MRRSFLAALAVFAALPALAHEGHAHKVMGTVTAVHADKGHVEVKDTKGATQSFYVDKATRLLKGKTTITLADLTTGTRVVAETKLKDGRYVATTVRLGGTKP